MCVEDIPRVRQRSIIVIKNQQYKKDPRWNDELGTC